MSIFNVKSKSHSVSYLLLLTLSIVGAVSFNSTIIESTIAAEVNQLSNQQRDLTDISHGKSAYQAGRYTEAQKLWQQAYQNSKNDLEQAQILNYLALSSHKLGQWQQAAEYITQSLNLLDNATEEANYLAVKAQIFNTKGRLELSQGKAEVALTSWQTASKLYQQLGDEVGELGIKINQAQAWQNLGLYRRAQKSLQQVAENLDTQSNPSLQITAWRNLGIALQATGDLDLARQALSKSLAISQKLNLQEESSNTLFNLGNVAQLQEDRSQARYFYQQAANSTSQPLLKTEALLNQLSLAVATEEWQEAKKLLSLAEASYSRLDNIASRKQVYLAVNLGKNLIKLDNNTSDSYQAEIPELLTAAIRQAKQLQDPQAESYAVGMLGHFYEQNQQLDKGRKYTQQAVKLASTINNADLTYQWQWQLGRLLKTQGNSQSAIASYSEAVNALENLRGDLVVANTDLQFGFRESIEPVYRELVSLLLTPENNSPVSQTNLRQARNTIESLQLAELNNFFREACLDATPTAIDEIDRQAAVVYPIILSDRLEIIVTLPDKSLQHYSQPISRSQLEPVIEELRQTLQIRSRRNFYQPAQQLYSWLIAPILPELSKHQIETLVFIPDGSLRNIPLGALHNGKQYLLENYNIALTPGLQLLAPLPLERVELKTLAAGITQQRRGFSSLQYVNNELDNIQQRTNSIVLRDDRFTQNNLKDKIATAEYPIVHIATHGQFSSNLDDTFLLAWDNDISIEQLNQLLQNTDPNKQTAIELLVLSACETARGDDRAALGLAGMAVRAGARTTLATLWTVYDESTALTMNNFYDRIAQPQNKVNKAQAIRQAQLELLRSRRFRHPYYWASFVMVGNWL